MAAPSRGPQLFRVEMDIADCEVEGKIPAEISGAFFRVGPDAQFPLKQGNIPFDGEGHVSRFRFENGRVSLKTRFVRNERYVAQEKAGKILFPMYRNPYLDDPSVKGKSRGTHNTHIIHHNGRLLALKEDSPPAALDLNTMATLDPVYRFNDQLKSATFTAHPKLDSKSGNLIGFGYEAKGFNTNDVNVFEFTPQGKKVWDVWVKVPYVGMLHDFAVTENYIVLYVIPMKIDLEQMEKGGIHWSWWSGEPTYFGYFRRGGAPPAIVGGLGPADGPVVPANIKGTPLMIDGTLYVTTPDNAWALDARDGHELWHYFWRTRGGTPIANRGAGIWHDKIYMVTPDNYLVSLESKTGKERWRKEVADFNQQYFSTAAPIIVGDHLLIGTGNDLDSPGYLQSLDPDTGEMQWRLYTVPMKTGDPGLETWPSLEAARYGGGHPWLPGVYDPETKLYIFGTGNPIPAYTAGRGEGDNLYTCTLIAVNVDTGRMAWHYQTSPHDMHDWDSAQTPVLFDAVIKGKPRKLVATAARNGYFFTLDRVTGEHLVTTKYGSATNWVKSIAPNGSLRRDPMKDALVPGAIVSPGSGGTINWEPPAYSPDTKLFYVSEHNGYSLYYLTDPDPRGSMGLGGHEEVEVGTGGDFLTAIDPTTGTVVWRRPYLGFWGGGGGGMLTTAGKLVFTGDAGGNLVAYDAATGVPVWHTHIGYVSNPPTTYLLDGRQYLLVAAGNTLYAFWLYK